MELQDYLRIVRRRWGLVAAVCLVVLSGAAIFTLTSTPQYSSSARLYVSSAQSNSAAALQSGLLSEQRITSYADLAKSRKLAETVKTDLGLNTDPSTLASQVSAEVVPSTVILQLTATDPDPHRAQMLAQAYAEGLSDMVRELETPTGKTVPPIKATIVEAASLPHGPVSPQPVRNLAIGFVLGLLLGLVAALLRDMVDTTIKGPEDLTATSDAPVLGTIAYDASARLQPLITSLDSHAPRVESFRVLRTNLQFVDVDAPEKIFVVTSAIPEEGKTTTSVNLAITLAQAGQRTLFIEGDLRRPRAAIALNMDQSVGVTTVLLGKVSIEDAIQKHVDSDLHVLGSGAIPPNPADLLQSKAMGDLLARLRQQYDVVIIDAPPLLPVTDAALLSAQADGAMIVVRYGHTTKDQFAQAVDRLKQVDARPIGVVINMVPKRGPRYGYGYGYGYGYAPDSAASGTAGTTIRRRRRKE